MAKATRDDGLLRCTRCGAVTFQVRDGVPFCLDCAAAEKGERSGETGDGDVAAVRYQKAEALAWFLERNQFRGEPRVEFYPAAADDGPHWMNPETGELIPAAERSRRWTAFLVDPARGEIVEEIDTDAPDLETAREKVDAELREMYAGSGLEVDRFEERTGLYL